MKQPIKLKHKHSYGDCLSYVWKSRAFSGEDIKLEIYECSACGKVKVVKAK